MFLIDQSTIWTCSPEAWLSIPCRVQPWALRLLALLEFNFIISSMEIDFGLSTGIKWVRSPQVWCIKWWYMCFMMSIGRTWLYHYNENIFINKHDSIRMPKSLLGKLLNHSFNYLFLHAFSLISIIRSITWDQEDYTRQTVMCQWRYHWLGAEEWLSWWIWKVNNESEKI